MIIYRNSFYWTHFKCLIFILFLYTSVGFAQSEKVEFDSLLARSLGADDYGMKQYIFVILKTGDVKIENKLQRDSLFAGHLSNIGRLAKEGKLAVAGPLGKNDKEYRGIFILNVKTKEEAETLLMTDPAIANRLLIPEVYQWYGAAALSEYLKVQKRITKVDIK